MLFLTGFNLKLKYAFNKKRREVFHSPVKIAYEKACKIYISLD